MIFKGTLLFLRKAVGTLANNKVKCIPVMRGVMHNQLFEERQGLSLSPTPACHL